MVKRIGRARRKTKHKLKQPYRRQGKIPLSRYFQEFNIGDRVVLRANLAISKGLYFPRFHGKTGSITGKKGSCYQVIIKNGSRQKIFNILPAHLKKI